MANERTTASPASCERFTTKLHLISKLFSKEAKAFFVLRANDRGMAVSVAALHANGRPQIWTEMRSEDEV